MPCTWNDLSPYAEWLQEQPGGLTRNVLAVLVVPWGTGPTWPGTISSYFRSNWLPVPDPSHPLSKLFPPIEGEFSGLVYDPATSEGAAIYVSVWAEAPVIRVGIRFSDRQVRIAPLDCGTDDDQTFVALSGRGDDEERYTITLTRSTILMRTAAGLSQGLLQPH
jgi:hypothetical protein